MANRRCIRQAFTLVELLVVIVLILILTGITVAFLPAIGDSARQSRAASMLQQWLLIAKQKALRDQVPCGVRLFFYKDPVTGVYANYTSAIDGQKYAYQVRECQYIEQPDDFAIVPSSSIGALSGQRAAVSAKGAFTQYVTISFSIGDQIALNDYLEILGSGLMYRIVGIDHPSASTTRLQLNSLLSYDVNPTKQYRIVRAPRVTGDDILQLPDSVIIDLKTNADYRNNIPGTSHTQLNKAGTGPPPVPVDILFSPSGAVITTGYTQDTINLWVRDVLENARYDPFSLRPKNMRQVEDVDYKDGEQTIVAIYVRTGASAAHPPSLLPVISAASVRSWDPYVFIRDGRTSGR